MSKMSADTRNDVNEAAVMQSITQNEELKKYCKTHNPPISFQEVINAYPNSQSDDMQILRSYVSSNPNNGNVQIRDYHSFGEGKGCSILVSDGSNVYVGFDGTGKNGWIDNGEGLCEVSTDLQRKAAERFDYYATDPRFADIMTEDNNIVVTGHSKGGNKAMFVTMNSQYGDLIDSCVSLDGQGFSPEAIEEWHRLYDDSEYQERVNKIISVSGQHDYVHELGISIVNPNNRYTVNFEGSKVHGILEELLIVGPLHDHQHLFRKQFNYQTGKWEYTAELNRDCNPGPIESLLNGFMSEYMSLDYEDRKASAPSVMKFLQKIFQGEVDSITREDIDGIVTALLLTKHGDAMILSLCSLLVVIAPLLGIELSLYILQLLIKYGKNKRENTATESPESTKNGSQEILLNQESFIELRTTLNTSFDYAKEAASYAERAEQLQHDLHICGALTQAIVKKTGVINSVMDIVVDSFSTTDKNLASEARKIGESYLGPDIYTMAAT